MVLVSHDFRLIDQVAKDIWVCEKQVRDDSATVLHLMLSTAMVVGVMDWSKHVLITACMGHMSRSLRTGHTARQMCWECRPVYCQALPAVARQYALPAYA